MVGVRILPGARDADWDLAIIDKKRNAVLSGSSQRASREIATAFVSKGQRIVLQTCRRDGASTLKLTYAFWRLPKVQKSSYKTKLVRVSTPTVAAGRRLERLGLDTTDHPGEFHWDVLLHSTRDEARLKASGSSSTACVSRMSARKDRQNRLREQRAGRARASRARARAAIVSGRTTYRTLPEIRGGAQGARRAEPWPRPPLRPPRSQCGKAARSTDRDRRKRHCDRSTVGLRTSRSARTTRVSGRPTRRRSSGASTSSTAIRRGDPRFDRLSSRAPAPSSSRCSTSTASTSRSSPRGSRRAAIIKIRSTRPTPAPPGTSRSAPAPTSARTAGR